MHFFLNVYLILDFYGDSKEVKIPCHLPQQILLSGSVNVFPWSKLIFFQITDISLDVFSPKRLAKSIFISDWRAVTFDSEKSLLRLRSWTHKAWRFSFCSHFFSGGHVYTRSTPHPGCQSPPGLWTIFSRESRTKPSFATGILGGG